MGIHALMHLTPSLSSLDMLSLGFPFVEKKTHVLAPNVVPQRTGHESRHRTAVLNPGEKSERRLRVAREAIPARHACRSSAPSMRSS